MQPPSCACNAFVSDYADGAFAHVSGGGHHAAAHMLWDGLFRFRAQSRHAAALSPAEDRSSGIHRIASVTISPGAVCGLAAGMHLSCWNRLIWSHPTLGPAANLLTICSPAVETGSALRHGRRRGVRPTRAQAAVPLKQPKPLLHLCDTASPFAGVPLPYGKPLDLCCTVFQLSQHTAFPAHTYWAALALSLQAWLCRPAVYGFGCLRLLVHAIGRPLLLCTSYRCEMLWSVNHRKTMVGILRENFAHLGLTYSIGGQISFDVFPKVMALCTALLLLFSDACFTPGTSKHVEQGLLFSKHSFSTYGNSYSHNRSCK